MDLHLTEASALAAIDRQIYSNNDNISPAQYEIVRRVIYHTADFEYFSSLKFSKDALSQGAASITASNPIVVDVPEIQVGIVPRLQQTFLNPAYCCATTITDIDLDKSKIVCGLEKLAQAHPRAIYIIGQDEAAFATLVELMRDKAIEPTLAIVTAPMLVEPEKRKFSSSSPIPAIYIEGSKGGSTVAAAIFKSLLDLTWRAKQMKSSSQ